MHVSDPTYTLTENMTMPRAHLAALTLSLGLLALGAVAVGPDAREKTPGVEQPDLIVARFHADWCGACKELAPKFDSLQRAAADESVLFVTLDLTSAESRRQSGLLAGALGLLAEPPWLRGGREPSYSCRREIARVTSTSDNAASPPRVIPDSAFGGGGGSRSFRNGSRYCAANGAKGAYGELGPAI